jgi:hypothetical protein
MATKQPFRFHDIFSKSPNTAIVRAFAKIGAGFAHA